MIYLKHLIGPISPPHLNPCAASFFNTYRYQEYLLSSQYLLSDSHYEYMNIVDYLDTKSSYDN